MADKNRNLSVSNEALPGEGRRGPQKEKSDKTERDIKEKSQEFIEGVSEVVEGAEIVETTGEVAEGQSEGRKKAPAGGGKGAQGTFTRMESVPPPSIEIMRIQVSTQIKHEIRILEKEAARLMRGAGGFHPFKLNAVISKIRYLRDILSGLAYATAETLKGWWMKFVKGITT